MSAITPHTAWVIWSDQHQAYWGPHAQGYRRSLAYAGVYTEHEAKHLAARSTGSVPRPLMEAQGERMPMKPGCVTYLLTMGAI